MRVDVRRASSVFLRRAWRTPIPQDTASRSRRGADAIRSSTVCRRSPTVY